MQKAKHRTSTVTKIVYVQAPAQNGNGTHKEHEWVVGDPPEMHPLFSLAGSHKDDPYQEEYEALMNNLRQEELERDLKWLDEAEQESAK